MNACEPLRSCRVLFNYPAPYVVWNRLVNRDMLRFADELSSYQFSA
jgi:hypothetical protein